MSATTSTIRQYRICPLLLLSGRRQWSRTTGEGPTSTTNAQWSRKFCHDNNGDTSLPTYFPWTQGSGSESQKVGKICGMLMCSKEVDKKQLAIVCSLLLWIKFWATTTVVMVMHLSLSDRIIIVIISSSSHGVLGSIRLHLHPDYPYPMNRRTEGAISQSRAFWIVCAQLYCNKKSYWTRSSYPFRYWSTGIMQACLAPTLCLLSMIWSSFHAFDW